MAKSVSQYAIVYQKCDTVHLRTLYLTFQRSHTRVTELHFPVPHLNPEYYFRSEHWEHILELAHAGVDESRWSLDMALERASKINCEQTYVPMWGEKLVWKNNKLN